MKYLFILLLYFRLTCFLAAQVQFDELFPSTPTFLRIEAINIGYIEIEDEEKRKEFLDMIFTNNQLCFFPDYEEGQLEVAFMLLPWYDDQFAYIEIDNIGNIYVHTIVSEGQKNIYTSRIDPAILSIFLSEIKSNGIHYAIPFLPENIIEDGKEVWMRLKDSTPYTLTIKSILDEGLTLVIENSEEQSRVLNMLANHAKVAIFPEEGEILYPTCVLDFYIEAYYEEEKFFTLDILQAPMIPHLIFYRNGEVEFPRYSFFVEEEFYEEFSRYLMRMIQ